MSKPYIPATEQVVNYISRYGSRCRDCADDGPVCPNSGLPCADREKAVRHVLRAINYGVANGFLKVDTRTVEQSEKGEN